MADSGWQMRMADGGWQMADGRWQMAYRVSHIAYRVSHIAFPPFPLFPFTFHHASRFPHFLYFPLPFITHHVSSISFISLYLSSRITLGRLPSPHIQHIRELLNAI
ncbi:MAG: hypothetical protein AABZ78_15990, partial [Chloroflexota bacterium]